MWWPAGSRLRPRPRPHRSKHQGRAGEQGWPGLFIFLTIQIISLVRLEIMRRRYRRSEGEDEWIAPLATSLQHFQLIYMIGSAFVQTAFQSFGWFIVAVQIGFDVWLKRRERDARQKPIAHGGGTARVSQATGTACF